MDRRLLAAAVVLALGGAAPAMAVPPNDSPAGAGAFTLYTAPNGIPTEQAAVADLVGATADPGVPRCLGSTSFARTVWYRLPEATTARLLTVEGTGRTTDPLDLAAFVQPPVPTPVVTPVPTATVTATPTPPPPIRSARRQIGTNTTVPNVCDGFGAGAGGDAPDATPAVEMLVPAGYPVLVQVGRRGAVGSQEDESALLSLEQTSVTLAPRPRGDTAGGASRLKQGDNFVDLAGATITGEDPAEPACPSLGTVWRKFIPGGPGLRLISVVGSAASTLTTFAGKKPTADNALDCVVRAQSGSLQMNVPVKRNQPVWVRLGVDTFDGDEEATITVKDGSTATVINGGTGGFDPSPYGPGGGFPTACDRADATKAKITGSTFGGRAGTYNVDRPSFKLRVTGSSVCDATLRLYGPGGHLYAKGVAVRLKPGRNTVALPRYRTFTAGRYHLEVTGNDAFDKHVRVSTSLRGRLRRK